MEPSPEIGGCFIVAALAVAAVLFIFSMPVIALFAALAVGIFAFIPAILDAWKNPWGY